LETLIDSSSVVQNDENAPLLDSTAVDVSAPECVTIDEANRFFTAVLDMELEKIKTFYEKKETEFYNMLQQLTIEIHKVERKEESYLSSLWNSPIGGTLNNPNHIRSREPSNDMTANNVKQDVSSGIRALDSWDEQRAGETSANSTIPGFLPYLIWSSGSLKNQRLGFIRRATSLYVYLCELQTYVEMNETGFYKTLKKYEKVVRAKLKDAYIQKVVDAYPFLSETKQNLKTAIERLVVLYARIATDGKIEVAEDILRSNLREFVVWERNTIWRDMIESERRRETIGFVTNAPNELAESAMVKVKIFGISCVVPTVIPSQLITFIMAIVVLIVICNSNMFPTPEQNNCFGILIFASILWAFEAVPLFVTSMIIPGLIVLLRVMTADGKRLDSKSTAKMIFSAMFGPVIMLLLGGFSLAAALSKHNIAKSMASIILEKAGTKPHAVLLANMFVSTFASMWISNVAAPVLCFSLISPILRNLPHRSSYARCLGTVETNFIYWNRHGSECWWNGISNCEPSKCYLNGYNESSSFVDRMVYNCPSALYLLRFMHLGSFACCLSTSREQNTSRAAHRSIYCNVFQWKAALHYSNMRYYDFTMVY
jgi:hypothetical protein